MEIRHTHAIHALFRTNIRNTLVRGLEHALLVTVFVTAINMRITDART